MERVATRWCMTMAKISVIALIALLCNGCSSTKYVPVESVKTEYLDRVREIHSVDSVTDTRFVYIKGDTIVDWRDKVRWRERIVHDTISIERTDTIREPCVVEKPLTRWQQAKMDFGGFAMGAVGAMAIFIFVLILRRISPKI